MNYRLAAMTASALLLTACANAPEKSSNIPHTRYPRAATAAAAAPQYPYPGETDPHARVKFVASESMLTGSAYISPKGCTPQAARPAGNTADTIAVFGPGTPSGLPFSPGQSLGMPGAQFSRDFTSEKRFIPGVPLTLGFQGTIGREYGRYTTDPTGKGGYQVGHHETFCSVAMTFIPQAGEDYMYALIIGKGLSPHCIVVPERYDPVAQRWIPLTSAHQVRRAPVCTATN